MAANLPNVNSPFVDSNGMIEQAWFFFLLGLVNSGNGFGYSNFANNIVPIGTVNGSNVNFVLPSVPNSAQSVCLYLNGVRLKQGVSGDYIISGEAITMNSAPQNGDNLLADYLI